MALRMAEGTEGEYLQGLVDAGCDIIFSTSYNYGITTKEFAQRYPDVEFCMATCSNANEEPYLENYHTFMGAIYEGRYASGVAAGMKLKELLDSGVITAEQARIGYVGAYPYAEVIKIIFGSCTSSCFSSARISTLEYFSIPT